jgi:hypothetical protein
VDVGVDVEVGGDVRWLGLGGGLGGMFEDGG